MVALPATATTAPSPPKPTSTEMMTADQTTRRMITHARVKARAMATTPMKTTEATAISLVGDQDQPLKMAMSVVARTPNPTTTSPPRTGPSTQNTRKRRIPTGPTRSRTTKPQGKEDIPMSHPSLPTNPKAPRSPSRTSRSMDSRTKASNRIEPTETQSLLVRWSLWLVRAVKR